MTNVLVTITNTWLTDVANPASSLAASFPDPTETIELEGEFRFYAGGRRRLITTENDAQDCPLVLQWLSDGDLERLVSWRGRVLLLRDSLGRRVFGSFLRLGVEHLDASGGTRHNASLVFGALTHSEVV